jgi:tetratricopeptide (TPR) repeat protein
MQDSLGNTVSTASREASRRLDEAIDLHSRAWPGALEAAQEATRHDPEFALAHAVQGLIHGTWGRREAGGAAMQRAMELASPASARERSLIELLHHVVHGRTHAALAALLVHLRHHPADLLALVPGMGAYGLFAFSGRADHNELRLELLDELEPHYPRNHPWLLAYRGWARIELGAVDEGLAMALTAIGLKPENGHNAHIIAHGFHEARRPSEYLDFLARWAERYPDDALLWGHLQWHAALAELDLDRQDAAVRRCLGPILSYLPRGAPFMGLADAPAILWRLALRGERGLPWDRVGEHVARHFPTGTNPFGELHVCIVAAAGRDAAALRASRDRLARWAGDGHHGAGAALEWSHALEALIGGDAAAAEVHFAACEAGAVRLGGSNAQRSIIAETHRAMFVPELIQAGDPRSPGRASA